MQQGLRKYKPTPRAIPQTALPIMLYARAGIQSGSPLTHPEHSLAYEVERETGRHARSMPFTVSLANDPDFDPIPPSQTTSVLGITQDPVVKSQKHFMVAVAGVTPLRIPASECKAYVAGTPVGIPGEVGNCIGYALDKPRWDACQDSWTVDVHIAHHYQNTPLTRAQETIRNDAYAAFEASLTTTETAVRFPNAALTPGVPEEAAEKILIGEGDADPKGLGVQYWFTKILAASPSLRFIPTDDILTNLGTIVAYGRDDPKIYCQAILAALRAAPADALEGDNYYKFAKADGDAFTAVTDAWLSYAKQTEKDQLERMQEAAVEGEVVTEAEASMAAPVPVVEPVKPKKARRKKRSTPTAAVMMTAEDLL